jgi:hypothetical protein
MVGVFVRPPVELSDVREKKVGPSSIEFFFLIRERALSLLNWMEGRRTRSRGVSSVTPNLENR